LIPETSICLRERHGWAKPFVQGGADRRAQRFRSA
jgi:hypothetical protein